MGNFLVVVNTLRFPKAAEQLFQAGIDLTRAMRAQTPSRIVRNDWGSAATWTRENGSGTPILSDEVTGNWILTSGTWFSSEGFGSGQERLLLERYAKVGAAQLARELEGFFVLVFGDARNREIIVLTDVVGSCHCFCRTFQHGIALSGSSLLLAALAESTLDPTACQEFLNTGVIYEDRTVHQEVKKLGPASILRFADGAIKSQERYWSVTDLWRESLRGRAAVEAFWHSVRGAAKRIGETFARPVCDLTGGYDSRALTAGMLGAGVRFSTVVSGPEESADVVVSRGLAQLLNLPHVHLLPLPQISFDAVKEALWYTDGEYDLAEYAWILHVHRTLAKQFDISLNGSFGELARGYWWELLLPRVGARRPLNAHRLASKRFAAQAFDQSLFPASLRLDLPSHFAEIIRRTNQGLSTLPNTLQMDHAYLEMRMQRWQGRIASSTNRLWPCLSPLMFRSVLEAVLQTRWQLRRGSLLIRKMLAEFQPRLANFPLEHGYPAMPVTWKTWPRFWPAARNFVRKVGSKLGVSLRRSSKSTSPAGGSDLPPHLQLWRSEEIQELLRIPDMKLSGILDPRALDVFLQHSQSAAFPYRSQWMRMLGLEYTLRVLESARRNNRT